MGGSCRVRFPGTRFQPIILDQGANLSEHLTVENSPVLFGCRTGICGTCLVRVTAGELPPPGDEEQDLLDVMAPKDSKARLACQLDLQDAIDIEVP